MKYLNVLGMFETLDDAARVNEICKMLGEGNFNVDVRCNRSNSVSCTFYSKDGVAYVFCKISRLKTGEVNWTFVDSKLYEELSDTTIFDFLEEVKSGGALVFKGIVLRGGVGIEYNDDGKRPCYNNDRLHRKVVSGDSVDHITHNRCINIKECLRGCTPAQNNLNKPFYSKVANDKKSFSAPVKVVEGVSREFLKKHGFEVKGKRVYSKRYDTMAEMYDALNAFEMKCLGEYCYNPLVDYTDTWYALVIQKMFGAFTELELKEYNRDYMIRNRPDIAEYYQLDV